MKKILELYFSIFGNEITYALVDCFRRTEILVIGIGQALFSRRLGKILFFIEISKTNAEKTLLMKKNNGFFYQKIDLKD